MFWQALPHSVPFFEWRINVGAGLTRDLGPWSTTDRHPSVSTFDNAAAAIFERVRADPLGLYWLDAFMFPATQPATLDVLGQHHITAGVLGPQRLLSTSGAVAAATIYQLSGFRIVLPYSTVRITNTGIAASDIDVSLVLRSR